MSRRLVLVVATAFTLGLLLAGVAPAENALHLYLDKSAPEADQIVTEAPTKIVLEFSEEPELAVSRIAVKGAHGDVKLKEVARSEEDETILWAAFEAPLTDGAYNVTWMTSSGDGHPVRGEFAFTVRAER